MQNLPYPEKKNRGKRKTGKVIVTTVILSSLILSSIGFVYAFYLDFSILNYQTQKAPLKISSDILFDNEFLGSGNKATSIFDLEMQKKEFTNQIQELSDELLETKNRLIQLKRDILIRGGKKESDYLEKITKLEEALSFTELKSSEDKKIILIKEHEIAKLQEELKEIETYYVEKSEKIQEELLASIDKYEKKLKQAENLLSQINLELSSYQNSSKNENISHLLTKIQNFIRLKERETKYATIKEGDLEIEGFNINHNETLAINETPPNIPQRKLRIEQHIDTTQNKIDQLEAQYADDYFQKADRFEEEILPQPFNENNDASSLYDSIFQLKNELDENEQKLNRLQNEYNNLENEKENEIIQLRHEIERLKKTKNNESPNHDSQRLEENYQHQLNNLRSELSKAYKNLDSFKNKEITFDKNYYENKIKFLEEAIDVQKEALLAAQEEILRVAEEEIDSQLEVFYQNQIETLTQKNFDLQDQLRHVNDKLKDFAETNRIKETNQIFHGNNQEIAYESFSDLSSNSLGKLIANLKSSLQLENEKRQAAEGEVRLLRDELLNFTGKNEFNDKKIEELEENVTSLKRYNEILKEELTAHEAANHLDENKVLFQPLDENLLRKLQAKITYLSSRLNLEKNKNDQAETRIEEMKITLKELKERNQKLEQLIHRE